MLHRFLSVGRYLLIVPVLGCVAMTLFIVTMVAGRIVYAANKLIVEADLSATAAKKMSIAVIEIIDLCLMAAVAYIAGAGIYKLFIAAEGVRLPMRLRIESLGDLENKIIGLIVAALAVAFLGHAAGGDAPEALLNYGGGIALVIAALAFFIRMSSKKEKKSEE